MVFVVVFVGGVWWFYFRYIVAIAILMVRALLLAVEVPQKMPLF
jgi:hypothetical protein